MYSGSPSLIHDSLVSVLDSESYARCMSHDDMNISVPVSCAVSGAAWKLMRAVLCFTEDVVSIPDLYFPPQDESLPQLLQAVQ